MTRGELAILGPIATRLREADRESWCSLKYQTQFGPIFQEFPYHPAAIDFEEPAQEAIHGLPKEKKADLVMFWRSQSRLVTVTPEEAILDRYGVMLVDYVVQLARSAGSRTIRW